ncbi:prepilin peptidase [Massilia sp. Root418]|uniref:prepilin peptidase n=1 Tax=Massilia sp. Root418 TaxID=1736532 RepID=UPI000B0A4380|nr:A24 family peptidase [Massilia sp. Root418]
MADAMLYTMAHTMARNMGRALPDTLPDALAHAFHKFSADPRMALPLLLLLGLLASAVWHDVRARRIPNALVLPGALAGLALQGALPPGAGLYSLPFGALGLLLGLAGMALGLALLLPMYMLGTMGAGDVKLLAMAGAFLGPQQVLGAGLLSLLAGGLLGLAVAARRGDLARVWANLRTMLLSAVLRRIGGGSVSVDAPATPTGQLPYAIAIAAGTALQLLLSDFPAWRELL